jgi:hypothetical protein
MAWHGRQDMARQAGHDMAGKTWPGWAENHCKTPRNHEFFSSWNQEAMALRLAVADTVRRSGVESSAVHGV